MLLYFKEKSTLNLYLVIEILQTGQLRTQQEREDPYNGSWGTVPLSHMVHVRLCLLLTGQAVWNCHHQMYWT